VVAKLDRLSRDVAFIATLMAKKVEFVTADDPTKSPFMLHIKAAMAEEERRQISDRTGTPFMAMFLHCCPVQRAITVHLRLLRWPGWKADLTLAARHAALPDPAVLPPISNPPSQGL
jgi:hypothetical protein